MRRRVGLITGASKGLGASMSRRFWCAGYSLHLVARNQGGLLAVKESLPKLEGQTCVLHVCDLADPIAVQNLIIEVHCSTSSLDVLINNAAIHGPIGPLWENDFLFWQQVIQVNLLAPVALCRAFIPLMKEASGGSIINLSGGGATSPRPNFSAYGASKTALVRFSETLAEESKPIGVRVNCIAPGAMRTEMLGEVLEQGANAAGKREFEIASKVFADGGASMGRVADLALFLASDKSNAITGKLISAVWDDWEHWSDHLDELLSSDAYTLRRIAGRDRGFTWGDK